MLVFCHDNYLLRADVTKIRIPHFVRLSSIRIPVRVTSILLNPGVDFIFAI